MRTAAIVGALCLLLAIGGCSASDSTPSVATTALARAAAPMLSDPHAPGGRVTFTVARAHVSEAIEFYQVSVDGGEWRPLATDEVRQDPGSGGFIVTLQAPQLAPDERVEVRLRAVNAAGAGQSSDAVSVAPPGVAGDPSGVVDVDSALGLSGADENSGPVANPRQQQIALVVEILAAIGLVAIGVFIGRLRYRHG